MCDIPNPLKDNPVKIPTAIKNALRGARYPVARAAELKALLPISQLTALAYAVPIFAGKERGMLPQRLPSNYSSLLTSPHFPAVDCNREIAWNCGFLLRHLPTINDFLKVRRNFDSSVLLGKWDEARDSLSEVHNRFGVSLWLAESRLAVVQASQGLEAQKIESRKIQDESGDNLVTALAYYMSQRNEGTINPLRFVRQFQSDLRSWKTEEDVADYLLLRLANVCPTQPNRVANILRYEATSSILDYYETFISLAMRCAVTDGCDAIRGFKPALELLAPLIADSRIERTLALLDLSNKCLPHSGSRDLRSFNAFATERYKECTELVAEQLASGESDLPLAILFAHATAELAPSDCPEIADTGILAQFTHLAQRLVAKRNFDEAYYELVRMALNFRSSQFSAQMHAFAVSEFSSYHRSNGEYENLAFLNETRLNVSGIRHLPKPLRVKYAAELIGRYGHQPSVGVAIDRCLDVEPQISVDDAFYSQHLLSEILIERALLHERWDDAISVATRVIVENNVSNRRRRRALRYKTHALLLSGSIDDLVQCIADNCVKDPGSIPMLPIRPCVQSLDKQARHRLSNMLSLSIVLDLCSRHYSDDYDSYRAYAYEDFLIAHGMRRPSELRGREADFESQLLIYYLKHLCIPEVMRISRAFKKTKDLEDERLAVCALLIDLDKDHADDYESEIQKITRNQIIQSGVGEIERSKIFIDSSAIRRWAEKELRESFNRYQTLARAGLSQIDGLEQAILDAVQAAASGTQLTRMLLSLPKSEADDLAATIVSRFLGECLSSPQYGLDCYLSMQIRHGVLSGHLRYPLEDARIITEKDSKTLDYKSNEYWEMRLSHLGPSVQQHVDEALRRFSQEYDRFVDSIKNDLVQIKTKDKPDGLFAIEFSPLIMRGVVQAVGADTTFEDFIEFCFQIFWDALEPCLQNVRNAIDRSLKPRMNQLFTDLERELAEIEMQGSFPELNSSIRHAQTKAQYALDRVQDWFRLGKPTDIQGYSFEEIIHIGLQYVKNIHRLFNPQLEIDADSMPTFRTLITFSNIFFIIFDNISRHSGLHRPKVSITARREASCLHVSVRSSVGSAVAPSDNRAKLEKIKQEISEGGYVGAVRSEGGTGLKKLYNIIRPDLNPGSRLDFGFSESGDFVVDFHIGFYSSSQ